MQHVAKRVLYTKHRVPVVINSYVQFLDGFIYVTSPEIDSFDYAWKCQYASNESAKKSITGDHLEQMISHVQEQINSEEFSYV